ncbi:putative short-chain dehydrogenase [Hyaloraphidium curvatum]|nr:putative short-chain dehydrogenase [Hyaloraphidium curvatum]
MAAMLRGAAFSTWGLYAFTASGYARSAKRYVASDLADMSGKAVVVTGANSGLGYAASVAFAKLNADVHMVCRSKGKGDEAREKIVKETGNERVYLHLLDLSSIASIRPFVEKLEAQLGGKGVSVLCNNAGVLNNEKVVCKEGLEESYATNLVGTFHLTELMLPLLEKAKPARVITVSSGGAYNASLSNLLTSPDSAKWDGVFAYAKQKRGQIELTNKWAEIYPFENSGIRFFSYHPGWSSTPGVARSLPAMDKSMGTMLRTQEQGADTMVWLAALPESLLAERGVKNGSFFFDRAVAVQHMTFSGTQASPEDVKKLYAMLLADTEKLVGKDNVSYAEDLRKRIGI